jgi:aromatic ring-opening dioxygenase catalytic subunit (LigB family)
MSDGGVASNSLRNLLKNLDIKKEELKAVLVISAHWEEGVTTVGTGASNKLV